MEDKEETYLIYVLEDGETWTMDEPLAVSVTGEQLSFIESGSKVSQVIPDWDCPRRITSVEVVGSGSAKKETAMESAQRFIDKTGGRLAEEQVKSGHLILHTIKVWVDHRGEISLAADISKKTILDLVERGEVTRHTLDGASVWDRDSEGRDICIDPDPPKVLEKLQEEYIDEHESVDIEGMKKELLYYSFKDVYECKDDFHGYNFKHLTETEKDIIGSQENFDRLLSTLRNGGE